MVLAADLELREELLKLIGNAVLFLAVQFGVVPPLVDALPELWRHEQRLDCAVEIARGALVAEANESTLPPLLLTRLKGFNLVVNLLQLALQPLMTPRSFRQIGLH